MFIKQAFHLAKNTCLKKTPGKECKHNKITEEYHSLKYFNQLHLLMLMQME